MKHKEDIMNNQIKLINDLLVREYRIDLMIDNKRVSKKIMARSENDAKEKLFCEAHLNGRKYNNISLLGIRSL